MRNTYVYTCTLCGEQKYEKHKASEMTTAATEASDAWEDGVTVETNGAQENAPNSTAGGCGASVCAPLLLLTVAAIPMVMKRKKDN